MAIPVSLLTVENVRKAAAIWRRESGYGRFGNGQRYEVKVGRALYPVKAIAAIALKLAGHPPLTPDDFPSRKNGTLHNAFEKLGFTIHDMGEQNRELPEPCPITVAGLLEIITGLGADIVITKNKKHQSESNFRIDASNPNQWLDGNWTGLPVQIEPDEAFVLHWVVHKSLVCIGCYRGTIPAATGGNCLILDKAHFYFITDIKGNSGAHETLRGILKQNGPVTYSYFRPMADSTPKGTPEQRFRIAQARLEQPAFHRAVMAHYGNRCVVSKCTTADLLDAAHLPGRDWRKGHNKASDGIALRVDLHRALDRKLIKLDKDHQLIWVSPSLNGLYDEYLFTARRAKRA
ncbi:HNH endonuclease [Paraburkholderia sabiae]|uniref:HNH endonuclease n=1 Tax=Paraburkholderia sabiae TaxID=273251 RepID=A0ABU9QMN1_9BURK|nr:HNH endonuclease [Paraburkholderia sabiae]WJZ79149.1 HNH endonuclease [Paraburkholderia sabiae]CAD6514468.1 hypothetical protein LMG24235_00926 [Paraburkholderia sabiae]